MRTNRIVGFPRWLGASLLLAALLTGVGTQTTIAADRDAQVRIQSPLQKVVVDGREFSFEAQLAFCADHQPAGRTRGFGFVELTSPEGDTLRLVPTWGTVDWRTRGVVLTFTPVVNRPIGPEDLVVAVVQPSVSDPGCLIWDLIGTGVSGQLPPPFDAAGRISLSQRGGECEPVDYGQLDAWVAINTPLQRVQPLPPSNIVGFEARIGLDRNQEARGFLDIHLPGETVRYEPIFGTMFSNDGVPLRGKVVLLRADRQAPLNINDHVLRATVALPAPAPNPPPPPPQPNPSPTNPDDLIWDLTNGESGRVDGLFDALGNIRVRLPRD